MKELDFSMCQLEDLEAPTFGEFVIGMGSGVGLGLLAAGVGLPITSYAVLDKARCMVKCADERWTCTQRRILRAILVGRDSWIQNV